jgi:hypothetical protein
VACFEVCRAILCDRTLGLIADAKWPGALEKNRSRNLRESREQAIEAAENYRRTGDESGYQYFKLTLSSQVSKATGLERWSI